MQLELLYDIIVVSIETDELDTIIHYCAAIVCYSSLCKNISNVSTFIELCNYYHEYFHCLSHLVSPLSL